MGRLTLLALVCACGVASAARALGPDNLLLLTNKNVPESRQLAEFYAEQRKVPANRIVELDLPTGDEAPFADYESRVIPTVREFITKNGLSERVTCLVTFYGVPLKIAARVNAAGDQVELAAIRQELRGTLDQLRVGVEGVEAVAKELDPGFSGGSDVSLPVLVARDNAARAAITTRGAHLTDPAVIDSVNARMMKLIVPISGEALAMQKQLQGLSAIAARWTPEEKQEAFALRDALVQMRAKLDALEARRGDPQSRSQLRVMVKARLGLIEYAGLLQGMAEYFNTENTDAAFDSELALLRWNYYTRGNSLPNPMNYRPQRRDLPPVLMTMRLDAPQASIVREMIAASIKAEADGLSGRAVVDAGGNLSIDPRNAAYAAFDRTLHALADVIRTKTSMPLLFDEGRDVLPARSVQEPVALYCGWYALQNYTPACRFVPGAVAYHVASFELTSLRNPSIRGWCRGLLSDGAVATLGAVNEPFLNAFPLPNEFFPLLMTGKLTLAEVYWKTNPMVSWRIAMIGDPLYNPFEKHPALAIEGLPAGLARALPAERTPGTPVPAVP